MLLVGPYGDRRCLRRPGALLAFTFGVVGLFLTRRRWGRGRWGRRGRESRRGGHLSGLRRRLGSGTVLLGQAARLGFGLPGRFRLVVCRRRVMVGGRRLLLGTDQFVLRLGGLLTGTDQFLVRRTDLLLCRDGLRPSGVRVLGRLHLLPLCLRGVQVRLGDELLAVCLGTGDDPLRLAPRTSDDPVGLATGTGQLGVQRGPPLYRLVLDHGPLVCHVRLDLGPDLLGLCGRRLDQPGGLLLGLGECRVGFGAQPVGVPLRGTDLGFQFGTALGRRLVLLGAPPGQYRLEVADGLVVLHPGVPEDALGLGALAGDALLRVDADRGRLLLGQRQYLPDPFAEMAARDVRGHRGRTPGALAVFDEFKLELL